LSSFSAIRPGDALPPYVAPRGLEAWNRFAAVNDEFVPVHMDDDAGRRAGNDAGAFGMGNLRLSYLANLLRAWAGDDAEIRELKVEYRSRHQKDDVLTATGTVVAVTVEHHEGLVTVAVDVVTDDGRSTAPGTAVVAFPLDSLAKPEMSQ
jgi:acyl dehydratase